LPTPPQPPSPALNRPISVGDVTPPSPSCRPLA
jgi:hypothetical protein